jgi:hypothetical protein
LLRPWNIATPQYGNIPMWPDNRYNSCVLKHDSTIKRVGFGLRSKYENPESRLNGTNEKSAEKFRSAYELQ